MNKKNFTLDGYIFLYDTVDITDPCYDDDVWCRSTINNIIAGKYNCYHKKENNRISESLIVHEDFDNDLFSNNLYKSNTDYYIGVDSGLAGYFNNKPNFTQPEWSIFCNKIKYNTGNFFYKENDPEPSGYFTESGFGDGEYLVLTYKHNNKIVALNMIFD